MKAIIASILIAAAVSIQAATYYVSTSGSDSYSGAQAQNPATPWRTISKAAGNVVAGDTVSISGGDYNENVELTRSGTEANPITFTGTSKNPWPQVYAIYLKGCKWVNINGIQFARYQCIGGGATWNASVRVLHTSSDVVVSNCLFGPGVFYKAVNADLDVASGTLYAPGAAWSSRGFTEGGTIWIGGCTATNNLTGVDYRNNNFGRAASIVGISGDFMDLSASWEAENDVDTFFMVYAGADKEGASGVYCSQGSGGTIWATNITFCYNIWSNTFAPSFEIVGYGWKIHNNEFNNLNCWGNRISGAEILIYSNFWHNNTNAAYLASSSDVRQDGATYYDYQVSFLQALTAGDNISFYYNWLQDIPQQFSGINEKDGGTGTNLAAYGYYFTNNVVIGTADNFGGGRNGLQIENNTFLNCGYNKSLAVSVGGDNASTPATNIYIRRNVFVSCGNPDAGLYNDPGGFTAQYVIDGDFRSNYITSFEALGWVACDSVFTNVGTVHGGDPMFVDIQNPLGPDGRPFTDDDGIRPLAGSPFANLGWGALPVIPATNGNPVAHWYVANSSQGNVWHEPEGYLFNTAWTNVAPWYRTNHVRPPWTIDAYSSNLPVTLTLCASNSIGGTGTGTNWTGITDFVWRIGSVSWHTNSPIITHQFLARQVVPVTLTVTNSNGNTDTLTREIRIDGPVYFVTTNGNDSMNGSAAWPWLTISKAVTEVAAGDTVLVGVGDYDEEGRFDAVSGSTTKRITFDGQNVATNRWWYFLNGASNITVQNFTTSGDEPVFYGYFWLTAGSHYNMISNIIIRGSTNYSRIQGIAMEHGTDYPFSDDSPSYNVFASNVISDITGVSGVTLQGTGNLFIGNTMTNLWLADWFRVGGLSNRIYGNYCRDNWYYPISGNHMDIFQFFGQALSGSIYHRIERNFVWGTHVGQIVQMNYSTNLTTGLQSNKWAAGNWIIANNIFVGTPAGGSQAIRSNRWYNNIFYNCATNGGGLGAAHPSEGDRGDGYGTIMLNNIFVDCGLSTRDNDGWYSGPALITNGGPSGALWEYNLVTKSINGVAWQPVREQCPAVAFRWCETNGINGGDPDFVNLSGLDFRLFDTSFLLGAGTNLTSLGITEDFAGNARPSSGAWTIGPYEYIVEEADLTPEMGVTPTTFTFSCAVGEDAPPQSYTIRNVGFTGDGFIYSIVPTESWIGLDNNAGTCTNETDTIYIVPASSGLSVGTYYGFITNYALIGETLQEIPQSVSLTVTNVGSVPVMSIWPTNIYVYSVTNKPNVTSNFYVQNVGGAGSVLVWSNTNPESLDWINYYPIYTNATSGQIVTNVITFDTGNIAGDYSGNLYIYGATNTGEYIVSVGMTLIETNLPPSPRVKIKGRIEVKGPVKNQ